MDADQPGTLEGKRYDVVMIATFVNTDHIETLLQSIIRNNDSLNILLVVVDQTDGTLLPAEVNSRVRIDWLHERGPLSLSRARNVALEYIKRLNIETAHFMFPDDDVTFDRAFFEHYKKIVREDTNYLIAVYNEGTNDYFCSFPSRDGIRIGRKEFEYSLSVNMIITQDNCEKTGAFDELMGVGAQYGAGEDRDFYLRACDHSTFVFTNQLHVYHPATRGQFSRLPLRALLKRYASYSRGYTYLLYRHRLFLHSFKLVCRALGASAYFLARLQFKRSLVQFHTAFIRLWYSIFFLIRYRVLFHQVRQAPQAPGFD